LAGAITTPKLNMPMAVPRRSGGKTRKMICMESGCSSPADAPCATRQSTITFASSATPAKTEAMMKTVMEPT